MKTILMMILIEQIMMVLIVRMGLILMMVLMARMMKKPMMVFMPDDSMWFLRGVRGRVGQDGLRRRQAD